jgi:hypothetical protein
MLRRPKSDGRCVHCRALLTKPTKDHVFPSSWYPDSTPPKVQRWTVPSCERCNKESGALEEELLHTLAFCIDPRKQAASGVSKRALRAFGIGVRGLSESERQIRRKLRDEFLRKLKPYDKSVDPYTIPGLGPHAGFPVEEQMQIGIPVNAVHSVAKKILRGCEYWLAEGRIVEPPYELEVYLPSETPEEVSRHLPFGLDYFGPGCRIRRAVPIDEPNVAIYEILIWETLKLYFSILPPEGTEPA